MTKTQMQSKFVEEFVQVWKTRIAAASPKERSALISTMKNFMDALKRQEVSIQK